MTDPIEQQVLHALFCLSRDTRHIDATTLAAALSLTPTRAADALLALEHAGLVDASRARLTMLGLATAVRLGPAAGGPRLDLAAIAPPPAPGPSEVPVAARAADRVREPVAEDAGVAAYRASICGHRAAFGPLAQRGDRLGHGRR
jgi:hypothetical protein